MFDKLTSYYKDKKPQSKITHIVAALGNPGKEYENTRHNAGWIALDYILKKEQVELKKLRFHALSADATIGQTRVLILKPQTYMNKSGESIILAADYYDIPPENVIVLCDDVEQDIGKIRIRAKGSAGGQNGLKSIISFLGAEFPRVRIGVGSKPDPRYDLADWVMSKFGDDDMKKLSARFPDVHDAVKYILSGDISKAMNQCN